MSGAVPGQSLPPTVPPKPGAIDPREAWRRIEAAVGPLPAERVPVAQAAGRWLAETAVAQLSLPMDTNSAMDGFAVRSAELPALAAPIAGESRAGVPFDGTAPAGAVVRIATGAALPEGFDAVVPIELAEVNESQATVQLPAAKVGRTSVTPVRTSALATSSSPPAHASRRASSSRSRPPGSPRCGAIAARSCRSS